MITNDIEIRNLTELLKKRNLNTHKGDYGTIGIIGGSNGMEGSLLLAARAAIKIGAGKVLVGFTQNTTPFNIDFMQPELMLRTAYNLLKVDDITRIHTWVIGCGMGKNHQSINILNKAINKINNQFIVLDADALNIIAQNNLNLQESTNTLIITPHPKEAARLLKCTTLEIQSNRIQAAIELTKKYNSWTILKGYRTIVCSPENKILVSKNGNPGLASAGTGDVLAGMIGSLLTQSISIEQALPGAVWLHGAAAEYLANNNNGPIGMTASELPEAARKIRNQLCYN
ncbi:putative sugar kinase [Candidatus Kinetoplastibacterium desouzaii TCC079E]|uniref:ADP-dependent (S)-NAD(P)H-hydrate dehydratase n=1 Tax=Candidatus Kinetoplastidibacterium desouzai TCC079E TaxID=1208919 RepID=M1M2U8_9PROT|nr:NAD(P)H-hydrate dehydratase [Candidatus Kinetoplastibacterium desouzaii]AGF46620.1 putative sugar kinase [Candidatus Kinetoplastibacterium desouzaii TCC079E]